jgi:uncharacterized protein (TIGR01244 family)
VRRPTTLLCLLILTVVAAGCQSGETVRRDAPAVTPLPVIDDELADEFNNIYRLGEVYFAGYPTEEGLRELRSRGVTTVVSLKTPEQVQKARGLDEQAVAEELGMTMVWIPISPDSFSEADVDRFAEVYEASEGPFLLHCGSSNTVGGLWAAYLKRKRDVPLDQALNIGRAAGLRAEAMVEATERVAGP